MTRHCQKCTKSFEKLADLRKHFIEFHRDAFPCRYCEKSWFTQSELKHHERIHTGEKPFKCKMCHRKFKSAHHLNRHTRIHTQENPFKCNICSRNFNDRSNMIRHKRVHTGEKPFKCSKCDKKLAHRESLLKHEAIHTGDKLHRCQYCPHTFRQRVGLVRHKRRFHNHPKLKCPWNGCTAEFYDLSGRSNHYKTNHDPTPYHCDQCNRKYEFKRELDHHKQKHLIMKTRKMQRN